MIGELWSANYNIAVAFFIRKEKTATPKEFIPKSLKYAWDSLAIFNNPNIVIKNEDVFQIGAVNSYTNRISNEYIPYLKTLSRFIETSFLRNHYFDSYQKYLSFLSNFKDNLLNYVKDNQFYKKMEASLAKYNFSLETDKHTTDFLARIMPCVPQYTADIKNNLIVESKSTSAEWLLPDSFISEQSVCNLSDDNFLQCFFNSSTKIIELHYLSKYYKSSFSIDDIVRATDFNKETAFFSKDYPEYQRIDQAKKLDFLKNKYKIIFIGGCNEDYQEISV